MRAAILSIGDELTLGQSLDTNSAWIAAQLAAAGVMTTEHRTVADDQAAIARAIAALAGEHDLLVTTGGLGPTSDDLTREALADVVTPGQPLVTDAASERHIRALFAVRKREMPEMNLRQAQRPATSRVLKNPNGTAPGLADTIGACAVYVLPGPPREMQPMFRTYVAPALQVSAGEAILTGEVHEFGLGESDAATRLGDMMNRGGDPTIGTTVKDGIVTARIRTRGSDDATRERLGKIISTIQDLWQPYAYGTGDMTLEAVVGAMLRERSATLCTAESCTGGWLGKLLVDVPGSSNYYLGGVVSYSNALKESLLGVDAKLLANHGAVSRETASAMALGALKRMNATHALSITGIAGPGGDVPGKPVGTVYIGLGVMTGSTPESLARRFEIPGDRLLVRERSARTALQMLRFALMGASPETPLLWQASTAESPNRN